MENQHQKKKSLGSKTIDCEKHGSYRSDKYILFGNRVSWSSCPTCSKEYQIKIDDEERKEKELYRERKLTACGITKRFMDASFKTYKPINDKAKNNFETIKSYCSKFDDVSKKGSSLIVCGTPGTGKTHLACAMTILLNDANIHTNYTTVYKMMARIKETYNKYSTETEQYVLEKLTTCKLLIIDEIGVQFGSEAEKVLFYQVINGRYDNVLPTVLISNLTVKELVEFIGDRCFDRLKEGSGVVLSFDWDSYRK